MIDTGRITNINDYGEPVVNCNDLVELVYQGKDINNLKVNDKRIEVYNNVLSDLNIDWPKIKTGFSISVGIFKIIKIPIKILTKPVVRFGVKKLFFINFCF